MDDNLELDTSGLDDEVPFVPVEFPGNPNDKYTNPAKESLPAFFYQDHPQPQYTFPQTRSVAEFEPEHTGAPGWFENLRHSWKHGNKIYQAGEYFLTPTNSYDDPVPEGWKVTPEDLTGFDESYWYVLKNATSPNDLDAKKQAIREEMKEDEYFANGGWISSLAGGVLGGITDPTSYIGLKWLAALKYATVPKTMMATAIRSAPLMGAHSFALESAVQANRVAGSLENAAYDAAVDTFFGTALISGGAGISKSMDNLKLWNSRDAFKMFAQKGIKIDPVLDANGNLTKEIRVTGTGGASVGAMESDLAQAWWTEQFDKSGAFAIPGLGKFLETTMQLGPITSPAAKAAFSPFVSVQKFYNGIAGARYYTAGVKAGLAPNESAYNASLRYSAKARDFADFYSTQFMEANGISGDTAAAKLKSFAQGITRNREISHQELGKEALSVLADETYKSDWSQAHVLADYMHQQLSEMNELHAKFSGNKMFEDPRNAWRYFPIKDDTAAMVSRKGQYLDLTVDLLTQQDARISEAIAPKNNTRRQVKELESTISSLEAGHPELENYQAQLRVAKSQYRKALSEYNKKVIEDPDYNILLKERNPLNLAERKELKKLLAPTRKGTEEEKAEALFQLHERVYKNEINPKFYTDELSGNPKFLNPRLVPKLRAVHKEGSHMEAARALWESKMNMTPNDVMSSVFGQMSPSISMPNYFKRRTNMLPVSEYIKAGFQDTDLPSLMTGYMQVVGRDLGFKEAFPEFARTRDFDGVLKGLKQEYDKRDKAILAKPESKTKHKELNKLHTEFEDARQFMQDTYNAYFGIQSSDMNPKLRDIITISRNITSASLLGGVVAYQAVELSALFIKNGIFKTFANGARPLLKAFGEQLKLEKGEAREAMRNNAAHAGLGVNTALNGLAMKWYNPSVLDTPPGSNAWFKTAVNATNKLAHYSMNVYGVNFLANLNEKIAATTFQSRLMAACHDHLNGTLSSFERQAMAHYGIEMPRDAEKFVKLMNEAGGYKDGRAYQSLYWKWSDNEAMIKMGDSIRRAVNDTVVNTNVFDSPYWTRNPMASVVFMFHGWAFSAFNRYAVPFMQRQSADTTLGLVAMIGLNALSEPLLRFANGKEMFKDDDEWWKHAWRGIEYSGMAGPNFDALATMNKFFGDPLWASSEKRSGYNRYSGLLGPTVGTTVGALDSIMHFGKGDATQGDLKKLVRIAPLESHYLIRQPINYFIENSDLPKKRPKHSD